MPRAVQRSARSSWDSSDLTWTARNQPVRTICAIARASVRSVLTGMALVAARSCRVSSSTTGRPAAFSPACSHCESGPASSPTREDQAGTVQGRPERVGFTLDLQLTDDGASTVDDADAAGLQRDVDPGIVGHGGASLRCGHPSRLEE